MLQSGMICPLNSFRKLGRSSELFLWHFYLSIRCFHCYTAEGAVAHLQLKVFSEGVSKNVTFLFLWRKSSMFRSMLSDFKCFISHMFSLKWTLCACVGDDLWRRVALHRHTRPAGQHVSWFLADDLGAGSQCHRHGNSWGGTARRDGTKRVVWNVSCILPCSRYRRADARRVTGTGPNWAPNTTRPRTASLRSPPSSARTPVAMRPQGWRWSTCCRGRSVPCGICSTRTGPNTAARNMCRDFCVSPPYFTLEVNVWTMKVNWIHTGQNTCWVVLFLSVSWRDPVGPASH